MARLTEEQLVEVRSFIMKRFSDEHIETPITKPQLNILLAEIDKVSDQAEKNLMDALPDCAQKDWLLSNQTIGRKIIERIVKKRSEVL